MRVTQALFIKQLKDFTKNMSVTIMFVMFPVLSFLMTSFMPETMADDAIFQNLNFAAMFMGMGPLVYVANTIAEDKEHKSLRFLIMAGVKSAQYLAGIIIFAVLMSIPGLLAFALIGGLEMQQVPLFVGVGLLGCIASSLLGATVGVFAKNVQQCAAYYTPLMMVMSFMPMMAFFNDTVAVVADFVFTRQIMLALLDIQIGIPYELANIGPLPSDMSTAMIVVGVSAAVFAILFGVVYKKKGLAK